MIKVTFSRLSMHEKSGQCCTEILERRDAGMVGMWILGSRSSLPFPSSLCVGPFEGKEKLEKPIVSVNFFI